METLRTSEHQWNPIPSSESFQVCDLASRHTGRCACSRRENMRNISGVGCLVALAITLTACQSKQSSAPSASQPAAESTPPLVLTGQVPLEGVKGRFDHFASGKGRVFVSGLGNNTVEVIGIFEGTRIHQITGVPNPQGVAFSPEANKLSVASGKGTLYIYDGASFKLITTLNFDGGADNLRYDAA